MIQMLVVDQRPTARLLCDVCQQQITDIRLAMVRWPRKEHSDCTVIEDFLVCHKITCDEKPSSWWEMHQFVAILLSSMGVHEGAVESFLGNYFKMIDDDKLLKAAEVDNEVDESGAS